MQSKAIINGNYLILFAIVSFCSLLLFLGFPFWAVFVFGAGMSSILVVLSIIRGIQVAPDLNKKE